MLRSVFFLSLNLLIGWQLSIRIGCKPFFSLPYNCQVPCFWRLALSIVVEVFPRPFPEYCSFKDVLYKLVMSNCMPLSMSGVYFFKFLEVNFLISSFEKFHHSLLYLSLLLLTFISCTLSQMHLWSSLHFFLGSIFLIQIPIFINFFFISKLRLF